MKPDEIIKLAATGINALLQILGNLRAEQGLTDDQIMAAVATHGADTQSAIAGYLAGLPKA